MKECYAGLWSNFNGSLLDIDISLENSVKEKIVSLCDNSIIYGL